MVHRYPIGVGLDEQGRITGSVSSLQGCRATGYDLEEMLDRLDDEVRRRLHSGEEPVDVEIELVGYGLSTA